MKQDEEEARARSGASSPIPSARSATPSPTPPPAPVRARHVFAAALLFAALTAAATWPQVAQPAGIPPHRDAWFNMWRLAWVAHQLPRDPLRLFDANIYHPAPRTLAYSDAMLIEGLLGAPFIRAGMPVPYVHALLVLASFVFAGTAAWLLVRTITGSATAGLAAGLVFAFTPYRFDHYQHLELLWTGFMPLVLLMLHRLAHRPTIRSGMLTGLLFGAQVLSCIYYGVFFATVLLPFVAVIAWPAGNRDRRRLLSSLLTAAAVAAALVVPYLLPYLDARGAVGERSDAETVLYSAGPRHYLSATPDNLLYGGVTGGAGREEKRLFPGFVAAVLVIAGIWPPATRVRAAYAGVLLVAVDLSFGPNGVLYGFLREYLPVYRGLRAPARAGAVALLAIAVLAGCGWARLGAAARLRSARAAGLLAGLGLLAMAAEYAVGPRQLVAAPLRAAPVYQWIAGQPAAAIVELPLPREHELPLHDAEFSYNSIFHWRPLVNGYSGQVPVSYIETLRALHPFPTDSAIQRLRELGVRYVLVHLSYYETAEVRSLIAALNARPDLRAQRRFVDPEVVVYEIGPRVE